MNKDIRIILFVFIVFVAGRAGPRTRLEPNTGAEWQRRKVLFHKYLPPRRADINGDGKVNFFDLAILANNWLKERR